MRTVVVIPDPALIHELETALAEFPEVEVVRTIPSYPQPEDLVRTIRARRPDCVFLGVQDFARFQACAAALDDRMPGLPVISVVREANPVELIPKLMHLGVREYLSAPITQAKLGETLASVARQLARHPSPIVRLGNLYAFLPAKPGVGASTIAVSTSCELAHELKVRTLLLDCDLMAGVTKFLLKLGNSASIVNALEHAGNLDEDMWAQMVGHWDGLDVLHAGELAPPDTVTSASLEVVLGLARGLYDTTCADVASSMDPFTVQVLHEAQQIFLVTTPELVPIYLAADRLRHLKELGMADKVTLLLNRTNPPRRVLSDAEVAQLVGLPIAYQFTNDYPVVQGAILEGSPVPPRSGLGQSIRSLAQSLAPAVSRCGEVHRHRRFLEFFHVPASRDRETVWKD